MGHVRTREPAIVNSKKEDVCTQWDELLFGNIHSQGNIINEVGMSLRLERRRDQAQKAQGDQNQFLRGEAIKTAVRITNLSGRDLHLGREDDWLSFRVESRDGKAIGASADVPVKGEFVLESGKRATKRVNLEPYFNLEQPGK